MLHFDTVILFVNTNYASFLPNPTSAAALALAATVALRTANPLRDFVQRYLLREHRFSLSTVS